MWWHIFKIPMYIDMYIDIDMYVPMYIDIDMSIKL